MTMLPAPESNRPPEGVYSIRLNQEPKLEDFPYKRKDGTSCMSKKIILYYEATGEAGIFLAVDSLLPWDQRYLDLLAALNVEHGRDIRMAGMTFAADIIHVADKHDATKVYPRLANIRPDTNQEIPVFEDEDKIPF